MLRILHLVLKLRFKTAQSALHLLDLRPEKLYQKLKQVSIFDESFRSFSRFGGLERTRTSDLTLIRRAL